MCWLLITIAISFATSLIAGVVSAYYVARMFEFRDVRSKACFALRPFAMNPEIAERTIIELNMCRDQLTSLGFPSVKSTFNEVIEWAEKHRNEGKVEVDGKRHDMMPRLEQLKPTLREWLLP